MIGFVETCSDADWGKKLDWEEWSVGVAARHIGAGHYSVIPLVQMIVAGEPLPPITMDTLTHSANEHARKHAGCTRNEVLDILRENGNALADYVEGLTGEELDLKGHVEITGDVAAGTLLKFVVLDSGGEHFANMKKAVAS